MTTLRLTWDLVKHTAVLFWNHPADVLAATFHHYLGDKERARQIINAIDAQDEA